MAGAASKLTEPSGKEADLYRRLPSGRIQCTACARLCQIGEGQVGLCGIRGVVNGSLYLLAYGKAIAAHIDPIEKKPVIHYRPGSKIFSIATSGCNWLCHPRGTEILLADGTKKNVEDILPGDILWSYHLEGEMEIRPNVVTHVGSRRGRLWEIRYGAGSHQRLLLTGEHPVWTDGGWKEAKKLQRGDSVLKVWYQSARGWKGRRAASTSKAAFRCVRCGEEVRGLENWNRHRGECYARGLAAPPEIPAARSRRMLSSDPKEGTKTARRTLQTSEAGFLRDPTYGWHRNAERTADRLHGRPSASRRRLYGLLDELGVEYEKGYRIRPGSTVEGSRAHYIADAAYPELRLDVEVDGWWRLRDDDAQEQDAARDKTLKADGWRVLRFAGPYVHDHPEEVKSLVAEYLSVPVMTNKKEWLAVRSAAPTERVEDVFSLESIPDHNYVADGVLVHNCRYCQNFDISQRRKVEGTELAPERAVKLSLEYGCEGIAYTYNEPAIFMEYARDIGRLARESGLFNIFVSNGYDTPEAVNEMRSFLDCITVDFKGSGETGFVRSYIGIPNADPVFQTLLEVRDRTKIHVEITDLIVPRVGDDLGAARRLARWVHDNLGPDTPMHFLRFHPDYKMMDFPETPVKTLEKHYDIAKGEGMRYVYIGNVPGHPAENTYCPGCGKVLIERSGYEIGAYNLDSKNRCRFCGYQTPIVGPLGGSARESRFVSVS